MKSIEMLFWSIALPGFGQLLNKKYVKGIVFIFLEFLVNIQSSFNNAILLSFHGEILSAIEIIDYQWLMFYPCLYFFAIWDAYKDAGGGKKRFSFLPFVFCAYFVTVGLVYSTTATFFGLLLGPVWFPMLCVIPGIIVGVSIQYILNKLIKTKGQVV